jgi:hypothetical protein
MLALLLLLIAAYVRLGIGRTLVPIAEKWLVRVPFSIYLAWISVATIANASSLLDYLSWGGWGISPEGWTIVMLIAATGIAAAVTLSRSDVAFGSVIVWAFAGIGVKHADAPVVSAAAWATAGAMVLVTALGAILGQRRQQLSTPTT